MASPKPSVGPSTRRRDSERQRDGGRGSTTVGSRNERDDEDTIGPYSIGEEIGRGSFATVYRGTRYDTRAPVAIKAVIRSKLTTKLLENLESEISILKRITHRNIVELKDCLKTETHIYLIMAFCSAGDLSIYIRKRGDLPSLTASNQGLLPHRAATPEPRKIMYPHPKEGGLNETIVRCFLGQLLDALKFLRAQNVIHRDIKPQNLLLQPAEASDLAAGHPPGIPVLKVADFGFARWLPSSSMAETLCGSPLYMAPEILRYEKYDAKADLWSVGAVLFEMSVGKPPFRAQNHVDLLRKIEKGEDKIRFPDERRTEDGDKTPTEVAPDLKALIRRLLKRVPADRMTFEDFFVEAQAVATGGSAVHLPPLVAQAIPVRAVSKSSAVPPAHRPAPPPPIDTAGAVTKPVLAINSNRASATPSPVVSDPSPPPPTKLPAYIDAEPPPFARRPTASTPARASPPPVPVVDAIPANLKVRDFGHAPPAGTSTPPSLGSTPPSALDRFAQSNKPPSESMSDSNDSFLGRDYVVVEKRTVEINALADELANGTKRETTVARRPSKGFLSRAPSTFTAGTNPSPPSTSSSPGPYPPVFDSSTTPPFAITSSRPAIPQIHPYALSSSPRPLSFLSSSPRSNPIERFPGSPLALVGSPTAAIAKVLNMASLKLFGSPTDGILLRRSSARKPLIRTAPAVDPGEEKVLAELEDIAQKALVIFDFADSRIMQILPPTPSSSTSLGTPSYFSHLAAREQAASNPFSPVPTAMRRTSSSSMERPLIVASSARAEVLAAEAMVLHLKSLAFLGKGIEKARTFWSTRSEQPPSADFNDAVQWFRTRFNECFDKAEFAKTRCGDDIPESATFAEKLIYDRALEISRAAAVNELRGENPTDCETAYETALWMLYALLDDTMGAPTAGGAGAVVEDEDRATVLKFVSSIRLRLDALRRKIG